MTNATVEQQARELLARMGIQNSQEFSSGDLVELAGLIATQRAPASRTRHAQPYKAPTREQLQALCDAFNFDCAIGGRVAANLDGTDAPLITTTRTPAQILSGHSAVVWLDGVSGCYDVSHVTPIPTTASAWAALAANGNVIIWSHDRATVARTAAKYGRPVVPYTPPAGDVLELAFEVRRVPRLPTPKQLRAALRHTPDAELAKSIYLAMTSAEAIAPDTATTRV